MTTESRPTSAPARTSCSRFAEWISVGIVYIVPTASILQSPKRGVRAGAAREPPKLTLGWTLDDPLQPGKAHAEKGVGFKYNQFKDVESMLFADGTQQTLETTP